MSCEVYCSMVVVISNLSLFEAIGRRAKQAMVVKAGAKNKGLLYDFF